MNRTQTSLTPPNPGPVGSKVRFLCVFVCLLFGFLFRFLFVLLVLKIPGFSSVGSVYQASWALIFQSALSILAN